MASLSDNSNQGKVVSKDDLFNKLSLIKVVLARLGWGDDCAEIKSIPCFRTGLGKLICCEFNQFKSGLNTVFNALNEELDSNAVDRGQSQA